MENILERAIIPRNPSPTALLNKEKYTLIENETSQKIIYI